MLTLSDRPDGGAPDGDPGLGAAAAGWAWHPRPLALRLVLAVVMVGVAALLSTVLAEPLGGAVFLLYFGAVAGAGSLLGTGPALLAVVLSAASVSAFALSPDGVPWPATTLETQRLLIFAVVAGGIGILGGTLRSDRIRAKARERVLRRRTDALAERMKEQRCLYAVSAVLDRTDLTPREAVSRALLEIPTGWRWPERTRARASFDGDMLGSAAGPPEGAAVERRELRGSEGPLGQLEVWIEVGAGGRPAFLHEELRLLDALADRMGEMLRRRAAEARLARSEAHFRSLVENIPEVIVMLDASGTNRYVSPGVEAMLGYTPEERLDRPTTELIHPDDLPEARAHLLGASAEPVEFRMRHADGRWRRVEAIGAHLGHPGEPDMVMVVARDVTERKELEERLQGAERLEAIGRLAGGVAHDFNNILTGIQGLIHLTLDALPDEGPGDLRDNLRQMETASRRAADLIRQLLAFSRQQVLRPRAVDLGETARSMAPLLERMLGPGVTVELDLAEDGTLVRVDPGQLEQVLLNLAVNARDAMPSGGRLAIRTAALSLSPAATQDFDFPVAPGEYALLTVTDTGVGMDEATLEHMFEPFFTTKAQGEGTGMGLSTVYGIVKQSDGYIWVESRPGAGTTVRVALPRTWEQADAPAARPEPRSAGGETILVVEDDDGVRVLARRVLTRAGYEVLEARHGEEALGILDGRSVDLLLTDVVMPVMGGRELMARVRQRHAGVPVLVMSGYADDREARVELGEEDAFFLAKPFTPDGLGRAVREALDRTTASS